MTVNLVSEPENKKYTETFLLVLVKRKWCLVITQSDWDESSLHLKTTYMLDMILLKNHY